MCIRDSCKVSNELAYWSNVSVDSLAFHRFGTEQGGISWRNHPVSKIWIVVYQKKASRDWSDCCTLYKVSNQFEYGLIALLGWKRSNVLFSHCTSTDVAFIRFGLDCKQKSSDASQPRGCWTFFPMNHSIEYRNLDGDFWLLIYIFSISMETFGHRNIYFGVTMATIRVRYILWNTDPGNCRPGRNNSNFWEMLFWRSITSRLCKVAS